MHASQGLDKCSMCGQSIAATCIAESIDGISLSFHSQTCASTFKKLLSVYGKDFLAESRKP